MIAVSPVKLVVSMTRGDGRRRVNYRCAISKMLVLKVAATTSDQPGSALIALLPST